jgi:nuclear pore complex protein Nup210
MSQPKILLPFHPRIETNFTLEATDGCFLWSSSRPDLVRIDPLGPFSKKNGENCSLHANVIAHTKQFLRSSATVYARDILTGQSVRCDVIIDKIQTIEIVYTTTRLYLEDAPELFKLRAHDQHGSTFSSIEHFPYEWRLLNAAIVDEQNIKKSPTGILDATKVIRILRLTDSSYEMSETVRNLESHGSLSYEILLEGLRTGSAFVQAEIIDNDLYHGIRTKSVRLSVSANVQFYPSTDVYLLPYSRLAFRLYQIKRQESTDITDLPSTRILYEVKLIDNNAGYLNEQTLLFTATDHADEQSRLELIDRNMKAIDNDTYEPTSLMIRIVNIGYLSAITNSTRPWIFQIGSYYLITVEMFDVNGRKIYPTDNLDLSSSIPSEHHKTCLTLKSLYQNGTQYILRPNCQGRFEIEFHLNGMKNNDIIEMPITASTKQWFEVYLPLSVQPKQILLPDKTTNKEIQIPYCPIKVLGGSGDYIFTSRDVSVVTVSSIGELIEQTSLNSTIVDVFDTKSPELNASVPIQVVQPDEFHLFPCPVETEINSLLYLPIQLFYKKQPITCCSHLDFDIFIDNNNIFQYQDIIPSDHQINQSCALLIFKPIKIGLTNIRIILKKSNLQQSILLSTYENLNINRNHLLLTTKSQYTLQLSNGPIQEFLKYQISPEDNHIEFNQDSNFLHIKCLQPIQHKQFDISKQNLITKQNLCPIKSTISIDITCKSTIDSLSLEPILDSQCPLTTRDYVLTYFDKILSIKILAYDENKILFDNFTSLKIDCSIKSKENLAELIQFNDQLEIIPKEKSGKILLKCSVDKIEQQLQIEFISNIQIKNSIKLIYINESLSPLEIHGGSSYFKFQTNELSDNQLIHLLMNETNSRLIFLKPLNYGRTTLMIIDQCLPLSKKKIDVIISDIDQLKIFGRSRLELNTTSLIYLQALDSEGNLFNLTNIYHLLNIIIKQSLKPEILSIDYESKSNIDYETLAYRIQGLIIGRTNMKFYTINIKSHLIEFEVYEKLRIEPKELNILPLSTIQLIILGGSQMPGTTIEWSTNDTNILDLEINNIFKTKQIGHAIIRAKSIGIDPLLGKSVVYGEDICSINVVQIHSIRLYTPTNEVLPNKFIPFTVLPYDHKKQSIVITDVFLHSLIFTWSLSNTHLAQFRPIIGNISSYTRTFVTNIETLRTGHVSIDVRLTTNSKNLNKLLLKSSHDLTNSIELIILEPFYINQFDETRTILLGPNSRLNLYHIPNDITLELSSTRNIQYDSKTKTIITDQNQYNEAILYMKYHGIKYEKTKTSSTIVGAYLIQVKPIHYILLQSYLSQETSALFSSIPVDYKLPLTVSYHDELGRR